VLPGVDQAGTRRHCLLRTAAGTSDSRANGPGRLSCAIAAHIALSKGEGILLSLKL